MTWEDRFRSARITLPDWAQDAPDRTVLISNAGGAFEIWTWNAGTGELRQATDRPNGTVDADISPDGEHVWWFDDTDGDELGTWRRQPFAGGASELALDIPPAYDAGLILGPDGLVAVGSTNADGSVLRVGQPHALREVYRSEDDASVSALSRDGSLLAISHSEHGDSRHPALRVLRVADASGSGDAVVGELWDGENLGVHAIGFAPVAGDTRLLVSHERHGRPELLVWDVVTGEQTELALDLPGEVGADWYPDSAALLVQSDHEARSTLARYDLTSGTLTVLDTPRGVILGATPRPDGSVWIFWSSAERPSVVRDLDTGTVLLTPPGDVVAPPSVPVEDVWAEGPGGRVHALLSRPAGLAAPYPTIFHVHGGPEAHDEDRFDAGVAAWVDNGYAVVQVNYRGSDGYGSAWREAIVGRVGTTELEDLAAVHAHLLAAGVLDPARVVLEGASWGGYLTLLGLGLQPDLWAAGLAIVPVADYVTAYADEMEQLQSYDRALFGGSPSEVPEAYRVSSPLTYVDSVRVPVYIAVGENDPRCPAQQVDNYVAELARLGYEHEVYRFDAGHGSLVVEERIRQMQRELDVALRWVPPTP